MAEACRRRRTVSRRRAVGLPATRMVTLGTATSSARRNARAVTAVAKIGRKARRGPYTGPPVRLAAILGSALALAVVSSAGAARPLRTGFLDPGAFAGPNADVSVVRARKAGATLTRVPLFWNRVATERPADPEDPNDPAYHWASVDRQVVDAVRGGLKPILCITNSPKSGGRSGGRPARDVALPGEVRAIRPCGGAALQRHVHSLRADGARAAVAVLGSAERAECRKQPRAPADRRAYGISRPLQEDGQRVRRRRARRRLGQRCGRGDSGAFRAPLEGHPGRPSDGVHERPALRLDAGAAPQDLLRTDAVRRLGAQSVLERRTGLDGESPWQRVDRRAAGDAHCSWPRSARAQLSRAGPPLFWVTEFNWDTKPPDPKGVPQRLHARWVSEVLFRMWRAGVSADSPRVRVRLRAPCWAGTLLHAEFFSRYCRAVVLDPGVGALRPSVRERLVVAVLSSVSGLVWKGARWS